MKTGEAWAYREKPRDVSWPILKVEVLQLGPARVQKVRVRFLDGEYSGLDMWVSIARVIEPAVATNIEPA